MKEKDTYQRVAIPMTDEQAQEAFACETCKGFSESLQYLKGFMDDVFTKGLIDGNPVSPKDHKEYHKHLDLVAHPDCDGQCVTGETMSLSCPHCDDRIFFNWYCFLPTKYTCPYCKGRVMLSLYPSRLKIVQSHNSMKGEPIS